MIRVVAGVNGAGKTSVLGRWLREEAGPVYDPDAVAARLVAANLSATLGEAQGEAWERGYKRLVAAVDAGSNFNLETTLAGATITRELERALRAGQPVRMLYVGLDSYDRHVARVRLRVARGGHDIDPDRIRTRLDQSLANLVKLAPRLTDLQLFDNSEEFEPTEARLPEPRLLLHVEAGTVVKSVPRNDVPSWVHAVFDAVRAP
jgi:predicted ABC-type ATPase